MGLPAFGDFQEQQWDSGLFLLPDPSPWGRRCVVTFGHGGKQYCSGCPQTSWRQRGSLRLGETMEVLGVDWHRLAWGRRVWEGKVNCSCARAVLQRRNSFPEGFWRVGCCSPPPTFSLCRRTTHLPTKEQLPSLQVPAVGERGSVPPSCALWVLLCRHPTPVTEEEASWLLLCSLCCGTGTSCTSPCVPALSARVSPAELCRLYRTHLRGLAPTSTR